MRLGKRRLAFLLTCSLLINSSRAQAGVLLEQPFVDRVLFITYVFKVCSIALSNSLQNFILGQQTLPSQDEVNQVNQLWENQQDGFAVYQAEHPTLVLIPSYGPQLSAWPDQLQAIAVIAPGLAETISRSYYSDVHLPVSGTLLGLLLKLVKHEDIYGAINSLEKKARERLREEARRFGCEKVVTLLTSPVSTPRLKKTNDNCCIDDSQAAENQPVPLKKEGKSKSSRRLSFLVKKEKRETKETPVEKVEVSVTENLIASDATPLDILLNFALTGGDRSLICHYYLLVATDEELTQFLQKPLGDLRHFNFAQALGSSFADQGFPNGVPSTAVLDMLRTILSGTTLGAQFESQLQLAHENSLSHLTVTIEDLDSIFAQFEDNAVISAAWTQSNVNLFRNLKPADLKYIDSEIPVKSSLSLLSEAFDNTLVWLQNLLEKQATLEAKLTLLERLVIIAHSMLKVGDYHGAFTIHIAFLKSDSYSMLNEFKKHRTHKKKMEKELMETFLFEHEYELCREKLSSLRASENSRFLSAALFYSIEFNKKRNVQKDRSGRIVELGTFLQQVHKDKSHAPKLENVNGELLNLFMNLAYLKVRK